MARRILPDDPASRHLARNLLDTIFRMAPSPEPFRFTRHLGNETEQTEYRSIKFNHSRRRLAKGIILRSKPPIEMPYGGRVWTVYALYDPRNFELRYIGCTLATARGRLCHHLAEAREPFNKSPRHKWLRELIAAGLVPRVFVIQRGNVDGREVIERHWIDHYSAAGADLLNSL